MNTFHIVAHGIQYTLDTWGRPIAACAHGKIQGKSRPTRITVRRRRPVQTPGERLAALFA